MKKCIVLLSFCALSFLGKAQNSAAALRLSLQECLDYAEKNSLALKQNQLSIQSAANTLEQSNWAKYPNLNGFWSNGLNLGRSIDPYSNDIATQTNATSNVGLQGSVTLFNGYQIRNNVNLNKLNVDAARYDLQAVKNQTFLNVATAYLNVLSAKDLLDVTQQQIQVTNLQLERSKRLILAGALAETAIYDLQAQASNDELQLVNNQNSLESAKFGLKQAINMPISQEIEVEKMVLPAISAERPYPQSIQQIYDTAISYMPEVQANQVRVKAAEVQKQLAQAQKYPSVSLNGSAGSAYASLAKSLSYGALKENISPNVYGSYNGVKIPIVSLTPEINRENIGYFKQIGDNYNSSLSVGVRVPIFNNYQVKYQTEAAEIRKKQTELQGDNIKLQIRQQIEQAYITMNNAAKRYQATQKQVEMSDLAFQVADKKMAAGAGNATEYNIAKANLDRAKANSILAKYDYVFRMKVLDFYQNKPLNF